MIIKQLPAEQVKIDQSFVREMLNDAEHGFIIDGIVGLAGSFERELLAEGV
ncbi:EAL domain-containing protein [Ectothiorhodospira haloalkaliphila]|uniref:EAL domain-containing protein n=1 Tax=Ectothiorhodospira haloalkaliphila TaxID=421628 RepID=UPI001EE82611|nr:EAL domain-containing protein [Ectothiorhodospira haloalkaliphila]MCG5526049.1 EAL domain-containing protein [Ectothiorhodospira haloalkaliphila]